MLKLGTQKHHNLLVDQIDSLAATGCFALTELGFGVPSPEGSYPSSQYLPSAERNQSLACIQSA